MSARRNAKSIFRKWTPFPSENATTKKKPGLVVDGLTR
jgi:hypothetical protein